jgi:hypothetical protein
MTIKGLRAEGQEGRAPIREGEIGAHWVSLRRVFDGMRAPLAPRAIFARI